MIKKLLKVLLIWWLFIPCFSFAWLQEFDLWYTEEITANANLWHTLLLQNNANFIMDDEYKIIQILGNSSSYNRMRTFFRNSDWMYTIVSKPYNNQPTFAQWQFRFVSIVQLSTLDLNFAPPLWNTSVSEFLDNPIYNNPDKLLVGGAWDLQSAWICFGYSDLDVAVCFSMDSWLTCWWYPTQCPDYVLTGNIMATSNELSYLSSFATNSPFVWSSDKPSYEIWEDKYTYWQIVEWYEACGLDVWYCYWWFPIDDIFEPNQSIEDFTWYKFWYGANIRYLYSLYSDTYTPKEFFNQMIQAYNNWQINRFKTEPKALIMFVQQYVSWKDRGLLNVWFYDLWDYCNIKLWYNDLSAEYTWHNQTPKACYNFKKTNEKNTWWFQFTWDNAFVSIVGTWWSWNRNAWEFFWNIWSMFQNWIGTVNTNYTWIIPVYILFFMFALILLRIITH